MVDIREEFHCIEGKELEVLRINPTTTHEPKAASIILLHEGLGSVSMWKSFPLTLAQATGHPVIVYSRAGHGKSSPAAGLPRDIMYMHDEGLVILPALIRSLGISRPVLLGHSDGASIALICAGGAEVRPGGLILMAPHVFVETISIDGIRATLNRWRHGDLEERLGRYHQNARAVFSGWSDTWLNDLFLKWNIEEYLREIKVPVLAVQGENDEYGTMAQIDTIKKALSHAVLLKLTNCGHSPHIDQPEILLKKIKQFIRGQVCNV